MTPRRGHVLAVLIISAVLAAVPGVARAERTLGLSSLSFKFTSAVGGTGSGSVVVSNSGDEDLTVFVYAADQVAKESGGIEYVVPGRDQSGFKSPASWLSIKMPADTQAVGNTPYLELAPGEQVPVDFTFEVPDDAPPGDSTVVLFFEMTTLEGGGEGTTSNVAGRIGARITINVEGVIREGVALEPFTVPRFVFDNEVPYSLTLRNSGNVDEVLSADVQMLTPDGEEVVGSRVATGTTLFASEVRDVVGGVVPPRTVIGARTIRATVTYVPQAGDKVEERLVEERTVWMIPLWLAIVVGAVVLLVALWLVWRVGAATAGRGGRKRADERRMEERRARREALRRAMEDDIERGSPPTAGATPPEDDGP